MKEKMENMRRVALSIFAYRELQRMDNENSITENLHKINQYSLGGFVGISFRSPEDLVNENQCRWEIWRTKTKAKTKIKNKNEI